MIVRPDGDSWLLIRQPDHAAMAADLLSHWQSDGLPDRNTRPVLLEATREHDCGWAAEDDAPSVDPEDGSPWDFIHLPVARRQAVWVRALRLLADRPHVAALVAHHAVTAYARYDDDPAWRAFFTTMGEERDSRVAALGTRATGVSFDSFLKDYASLRAADLISLALCHGWQDRFELDHYKGVPDGANLTLTPDPFAGATVSWRVPARRIPRRPYASDDDLRGAFAAAAIESLAGQVQGRPEPLPS
ncbi:DUF3891 family protein [Luteitalea pratensis]|uniref:DUF3891 family protein n=1 Tax=Luteitalea pratensis TaxID=1855912 RepID=UPI0012FF7ADC|nr:DUF3891 family protein [Luteitalea pratensis]